MFRSGFRFVFLLSCAFAFSAATVVNAQCDPSPCEETVNQNNEVDISIETTVPIPGSISETITNNVSQSIEHPTNITSNQSNNLDLTLILSGGGLDASIGESNETDITENSHAVSELVNQTNQFQLDLELDSEAQDDQVEFSQSNHQMTESTVQDTGNDQFNSTNLIDAGIDLGGGNDSLSLYQESLIENNTSGDDTVSVNHTVNVNIEAGSGNDTILIDSQISVTQQGQPYSRTRITNQITGSIDGGSGNDLVSLSSNAAGNTRGSGPGSLFIDGGDGVDTLALDFNAGTVSQAQADQYAYYMANNSPSGTITINGVVFTWANFEQLSLLIQYAIAVLGDSPTAYTITFTDGRLNAEDVAAPVAIYCANGGFTVWQIDPNTGNGTQVIATTLAELGLAPVSGGMATLALAEGGTVQLTTTSGYSFSFDPAVCGSSS
jgi:hypothetical protein